MVAFCVLICLPFNHRFPRPKGRGSLIFAQNSLHPRDESRGFFAQNKSDIYQIVLGTRLIYNFVMPFKTKRQKQAAVSRRFSFDAGGAVTYSGSQSEVKNHPRLIETKKVGTKNLFDGLDLSYIRKDLLKITLLAILIISSQLLLKFYLK